VARPCKKVIKYVNFSWRMQQLWSATVSNWRRNTAHDVIPSNFGGFAALAPDPGIFPRSARASTSFTWVWNSRQVIVWASNWSSS
jgi:hypothetical protein